jgi:predicted SAM-dependent methyltransferase
MGTKNRAPEGADAGAPLAPDPAWGIDAMSLLERVASASAALPHDMLGLGASARMAAEPLLIEELSSDMGRRLTHVAAEFEDLRTRLQSIRQAYLDRQLSALGIKQDTRGLRLNLTGERPLDGWINVGAHPSGLVMNLLWPLPFAAGSALRVYFAMGIEHFSMPEALGILREVRRVLAPGGVLRVVTQDTEQYLAAYCRRDVSFFEAQRKYWDIPPGDRPLLQQVLAWTGAPRRPQDFFDHKYAYDFESLAWLLRRAGFQSIERSAYMASRHEDLRVDTNSADAGATHENGFYGLFVEAAR